MRVQILTLLAIALVSSVANAESLGGVWHVATTECGGKPSNLFTISESTNDGPVSAVYKLDAIEFASRNVTFVVGGQRLKASTSLRLSGEKGSFKMKLLGNSKTPVNHPMQPNSEGGRFEVDEQPSAGRARYPTNGLVSCRPSLSLTTRRY